MAFNVGVHDWFKMLKLAILEQVYNVDLNDKKMHIYNKQNVISLSCIVPKNEGLYLPDNQTPSVHISVSSRPKCRKVCPVYPVKTDKRYLTVLVKRTN